jgi:hypothetical protein
MVVYKRLCTSLYCPLKKKKKNPPRASGETYRDHINEDLTFELPQFVTSNNHTAAYYTI